MTKANLINNAYVLLNEVMVKETDEELIKEIGKMNAALLDLLDLYKVRGKAYEGA